ncbi:MAG: HAMP domain-containing protein [Pseudomonadales bacterium]|nr:HAMP domain-containing protein [Pseudomonadales bacterium]
MSSNRSIPLKWKVVLGVTITSTVSVILAILVFATLETKRLEKSLIAESETIAKIVGGNSVGALAFMDSESGLETLTALKANPHIHDVALYDDAGAPFVWYYWSGDNSDQVKMGTIDDFPDRLPKKAPQPNIIRMEHNFSISQDIIAEGSVIGTIYVLTDFKILEDTIANYFSITLIICAGVALFSLLLAILIQRNIVAPINEVVFALRDIAEGEGDLTRRLQVSTDDELGKLVIWFNTFVEKIQHVILQVRTTANELSTAATDLNALSNTTSKSIIGQQKEIELVLTSMQEMSTTVQEVTDSVENSAKDSEQADAESKLGREVVGETMDAIEALASDIETAAHVITKLQQDSDSIGTVLDVIRGIAEQTNLLALNAAIEAARAGEQGRGFAVVADEVRTLASRTQESTQEIHDMIESLQSGSREAVTVMDKGRNQAHASVETAEKARSSLVAITNAVSTIKDVSKQIAGASSEQLTMTGEINVNVVNISSGIGKTSEGSKEMNSRAEELDQLSNDMLRLVGQFRV